MDYESSLLHTSRESENSTAILTGKFSPKNSNLRWWTK